MTHERRIDALIAVLHDPDEMDAYDRAFSLVGSDPLAIADELLPPDFALAYQRQELSCNELADLGSEATHAVPALLQCAKDKGDDITAKSMRLAAVSAIWRITNDPSMTVALAEKLLLDDECWFRRQVCEFLGEVAHPAALPVLQERQANDIRPEVREAARRAIEKIEPAAE